MSRHALRFAVAILLLVPGMALAAEGGDPYSTAILLSDGKAGAPMEFTFSFRSTRATVEKVSAIEIGLPEGAVVHPGAFRHTCVLARGKADSAAHCGEKYPRARVGAGKMTVEMLGMHTVTAEAYRIEEGAGGANLVFYFPPGQVFGVGAQSIRGAVTLDGSSPARIRIFDIQRQLDLPFGATAELEAGSFTFSGESGQSGFSNPEEGTRADWVFDTVLAWQGARQKQSVRPTSTK